MLDTKECMRRALEMGALAGTWTSELAREVAARIDAEALDALSPAVVAAWLGVEPAAVSSLLQLAESVGATPPTMRVARDAAASPPPRTTTPTIPDDAPPPAPRPRMPHKLGRYVIKDILGEGGMGIVYLAEHEELKAPCAVKVLGGGSGFSAKALERFRREAAAVARMGKHPHIVTVYDLGEDKQEGVTYFAMELVQGKSLKETLRERDYAPKEAAALVEKVARAVHHAHGIGVLHRDLKPDNVMVREADQEPLVVDFGLAREVGTEAGKSLAAVGTPNYMAPEQARGQDELIDAGTDVYGLGGILYETLTHLPPHPGQDVPQVLMHILRREVLPPRRARPDVPRDLETICLKCLDSERGKRYATADALADDLARFQRGEPVLARPVGRVERGVRWVRRNPVPAVAAVAVLVALLGGIGLTEWRASSRRRAEYASLVADAEERLARLPGDQEGAIGELVTVEERLRAAQELMAAHGGGPLPRRYEVNRELGDKALEARDYLLAKLAFSVCRSVDAKRAEAEGLDKRGDEAKQREALRRKRRIETALADLTQGLGRTGRDRGAPDLEDYVFEVSGYRDEQTVELLAQALSPLREKGEREGKAAHWTQEEQDVMTFALRVLGRVGLESAVEPLGGMMTVLWDHPLAVECGTALCNTRSARANGPLLATCHRLGINSSTWFAIEHTFARVPSVEHDAEPQTANAFINRGNVRKAKGDVKGAIADYTRAIELDPKLAGAFNNRGLARRHRGDTEGAIGDYTRAIELDPNYVDAFNNRGLDRKEKGDLGGAIGDYTRAIELDPKYAGAFNNRGLARKENGDLEGAIADCTRAIELDPQDPLAFNNRGRARAAKGDVEGAIEDYTRAIELDPRLADAFNNRGGARAAKGDVEGAIADCTRAIELNPKYAVAFYNRGRARAAKGDVEGEIEDDTRAIELDPRDADAFNNRGAARKDKGDVDGAIGDCTRAIELDPKNAAAFNNRGLARAQKGDAQGAIADYDAALRLNPRDWKACGNKGLALEANGRPAEAAKCYELALAINPGQARLQTLLARAREAAAAGGIAPWATKLRDADAVVQRGEYPAARPMYEEALANAPGNPDAAAKALLLGAHYNLACILSLASVGKDGPKAEAKPIPADDASRLRERAFRELRAAIDLGSSDAKHFSESADLAPLHDDPRWAEVLKRLRH